MTTPRQIRWIVLLLVAGLHTSTTCAQEFSWVMSPTLVKELEDKTLEYVDRLGIYLTVIADKESYAEVIEEVTRLRLQLFDRLDAIVEVSSTHRRESRAYTIEEYLGRLRGLPYSQAKIEWANLASVSGLKRGTDGNYFGVATIEQRFVGYHDGQPIYVDVTTKYIQLVVKQEFVITGGAHKEDWVVFLSDISVEHMWDPNGLTFSPNSGITERGSQELVGIYLGIISNEASYREEIEAAKRMALLFVADEESLAVVSSDGQFTTYPIGPYLDRLQSASQDHLEVNTFQIDTEGNMTEVNITQIKRE